MYGDNYSVVVLNWKARGTECANWIKLSQGAEWKGRESCGLLAFCLLFLCEKQMLFNYSLFFFTNGQYLAGNALIEF